MSYTLRGRLESRLSRRCWCRSLAAAACSRSPCTAGGRSRSAALMVGVGAGARRRLYHRLLRYQPGWAALPLGAARARCSCIGAVLARRASWRPLGPALALFAAGWLLAPGARARRSARWLRLSYAEDGGELGRTGVVRGRGRRRPVPAAGGALRGRNLPPTVHLRAGVDQRAARDRHARGTSSAGPGTVVAAASSSAHSDVKIRNVTRRRRRERDRRRTATGTSRSTTSPSSARSWTGSTSATRRS